MAKDRESLTIDKGINKEIKEQATKEGRSYSNMLEWIAKKYLELVNEKK